MQDPPRDVFIFCCVNLLGVDMCFRCVTFYVLIYRAEYLVGVVNFPRTDMVAAQRGVVSSMCRQCVRTVCLCVFVK